MSRLVYRDLGPDGARWPDWMRELRNKSGVYAIKQHGTLVYVGESHRGTLYGTLTRHFQAWRRRKKFWHGLIGGKRHDPGVTYRRGSCSVAVIVTPAGKAVDRQYALIQRLKPRDNVIDDSGDRVPF